MRFRATARALAAAGALLTIVACNQNGDTMSFDGEVRHENGLSASRPAGFKEMKTPSGFVFTESGDMRSPRTVRVDLSASEPQLTDTEKRSVGGIEVTYAVSELGSGSGGTEYELQAIKPSGGSWIVLKAIEQTEEAEPAFLAGWAVLEKASAGR